MKIVSWNVNGIRAAIKKGFVSSIAELDADVVCLQEVRATREQFDLQLDGYSLIINAAQKKGYSGTALLSRVPLENVQMGMGIKKHDQEGRLIVAELDDFFLVTVYTPNAQRGLGRLDYRMDWDRDFLKLMKKLEKKRPVVFCGDLNVAHKEIDLKNPKSNRNNAGFTDEERAGFDAFVAAGFVDTFREFNKQPDQYTWWSNFGRARERNVGWRIDYFCVSQVMLPRLVDATIEPNILGSDHCPTTLTFQSGAN